MLIRSFDVLSPKTIEKLQNWLELPLNRETFIYANTQSLL